MKGRFRAVVIASTCLVAGLVLNAEPVVLRDLAGGSSTLRLTVDAVRAPLWSAAFAQQAGDFTMENLNVALDSATFTMKSVRFSGVASTRAEIDALFSPGATDPLSTRLARIKAKEIVIPEIAFETRGALKERGIYRGVVFMDVADGRIGKAVIESATAEAETSAASTAASYGRMVAEGTDIAGMAKIYGEGAGQTAAAPILLQKSFSFENIFAKDTRGLTMKLTRGSGRDIRMRPGSEPLYELLKVAMELEQASQPSDEVARRMFTGALDILTGAEIGAFELSGLEFAGPPEKPDLVGRISRMAFLGRTADKPADLRLEGFEVKAADGTAKIDVLSFSGFSFDSTFAALRTLKDKPVDEWANLDPATLRALVPTIGTIRYAGIAFDVPNEKGQNPERVKFSAKDVELTAGKPINGVPTIVRLEVQNLAMPVPEDANDEAIRELRDMGYKAIDVSWRIAAAWNEQAREIGFNEISFEGVNMGRLAAKAVFGGIGREAFDPDSTMAMIALFGATAKSLDLTLDNAGIVERLIERTAKQQNKSPDAVRREVAAAATTMIPMMLGSSDQSRALGQAIARFVAKPVRLRISAKAKNPEGLGFSDIAGADTPARFLSKLDIKAVAEDKP